MTMTRRSLPALAACATILALVATPPAAIAQPVYVDQGPNWSEVPRAQFYSMDQGARMIPLAWLRALKQADGKPFLTESFARYGYLPNTLSASGLPVGFTTSGPPGAENTGMTCSACHTREITAEGKSYRIDGGPAIVDFQSLLADLDAAVQRVLKQPAQFKEFSASVLGPNPPQGAAAQLLLDVNAWSLRFHTLTSRALPQDKPWGYARLDAVGMIFNRLAGLDVGPPPSYVIASNIKKADAPVRYPFLWNAAYQDKTQWPGFADNGNDVLGLARNVGEVVGVFGVFQPKREGLFVNFTTIPSTSRISGRSKISSRSSARRSGRGTCNPARRATARSSTIARPQMAAAWSATRRVRPPSVTRRPRNHSRRRCWT
jgi:hypothetical protein